MNQFDKDIESTIKLYVRKELSSELVEPFEDYFVDKPELTEKIEIARDMTLGLKELDVAEMSFDPSSDLESPSYQISKSWRKFDLLPRLWSWVVIPVPAYATAALCAVIVAWLGLPQEPKPVAPSLVGFSTQLTRSTGQAVYVDLSTTETNRAVFLRVPSVKYRSYRLAVIDPELENTVWQSDPFSFSALNDQMVVLPPSLRIAKAKLVLLGDQLGQPAASVRFCHYSEPCE